MVPVPFRVGLMVFLVSVYLLQTFLVYSDKGGTQAYVEGRPVGIALSEEAQKGRDLYLKNNCQSCHQIYGYGGILGPDLTNFVSRFPEPSRRQSRLATILTLGNLQMPAFHMPPGDIRAMEAYLIELDKTGISQPSAYPPFRPDYEGYFRKLKSGGELPGAVARGMEKVLAQCAICHQPFNDFGSGPYLLGVTKRMARDKIEETLRLGRPGKMPDMRGNNLSEEDLAAVMEFLMWMDAQEDTLDAMVREDEAKLRSEERPVPWFVYPDLEAVGGKPSPYGSRRHTFYPNRKAGE